MPSNDNSLFLNMQIFNASMNVHSFTHILRDVFATAGVSRA